HDNNKYSTTTSTTTKHRKSNFNEAHRTYGKFASIQLSPEERLDKHGSRLYKLENINIPHQVSKAVDEIVTDAVDWAIQAPLRAHQLLSDLEEARQKKRKRRDVPRTPYGSPPPQPPPPPPLAGTSGALGTSKASGSSQFPPPPPPLSTGTFRSAQQQGSEAPSSSKSAASAPQSIDWTTSGTRYESAGLSRSQELSPMDSLI
nr:hypothetical protein [Tanacetum cinerariifolium]